MTKIPKTSLIFENDYFPIAISMLSELLRRDPNFNLNRKIEDKIHVCCRETSILLIAILKAKNIPSRIRCGFTHSVSQNNGAGEHWIAEYYDKNEERWILVDLTLQYDDGILEELGIDYPLIDMPRDKFIFSAEAYLGLRSGKYKEEDIYTFSNPFTYGLNGAMIELFYEYHSLINNEILFTQNPKYARDKNYRLSEEEYKELDELATLMLNPYKNFDKLIDIWNTNEKI